MSPTYTAKTAHPCQELGRPQPQPYVLAGNQYLLRMTVAFHGRKSHRNTQTDWGSHEPISSAAQQEAGGNHVLGHSRPHGQIGEEQTGVHEASEFARRRND
jgi:hypothetical protein